jgi:hypothetical protein
VIGQNTRFSAAFGLGMFVFRTVNRRLQHNVNNHAMQTHVAVDIDIVFCLCLLLQSKYRSLTLKLNQTKANNEQIQMIYLFISGCTVRV